MAARNSYKHGGRTAEAIEDMRRILSMMRDFRNVREELTD